MAIHRAVVTAVRPLSAGMVRITFAGPGLADFVTTGIGDEYLRIWFPTGTDRTEVNLPHEVTEGRGWAFDEGTEPAPLRTYTVRAVRPASADAELEVDIDFVVHEGGVAATWALAAAPGDVVGVNTPREIYALPAGARHQILVGDQTALPAIARILETTPGGVRSTVVIEVPDEAHHLDLPQRPDIETRWVHGGNGHGATRLAEIVRSLPVADADYVWMAGEARAARESRKYLRRELELPAERWCTTGYWTENAEQWRDRYEALPADVKTQLVEMWADETRDSEEIEDEYTERLEKLGL